MAGHLWEKKKFSKEQFIEIFDPARLSKSPALFDTSKLRWMNNQYMKQLDLDEVVALSVPHLVKAGKVEETRDAETEQWVRDLVALYQNK